MLVCLKIRKHLDREWELKRHLFRLCIVIFLFWDISHKPHIKLELTTLFSLTLDILLYNSNNTILEITLINTINCNDFKHFIGIGEFSHTFNSVMSCF